jgi:D-glycero-alpha-D-manno-heptose 1-phosphate guanylyltransferase
VKPPLTCIVLAGGLGTRLRSELGDLPKCLAPVGARPFLDLQLEALYAAGVDEVVLSLGHESGQVLAAVAAGPAGRRLRSVVEPSLLGTGGAIAHVLDSLALDEVLVANGDTYLDGDIAAMRAPLDRGAGELLRMALVEVPDRGRFGGVELDARGRVQRFIEKGRHDAGAINAGLYRLCRAALPQRQGPYSLEADVLPGLVAQAAVTGQAVAGSFIDIGVPEDYRRFCARHSQGPEAP